ncbi:MAG: hypothetical protein EBX52_13090, partial [Proteobacteria bacterium]|nr:hypothetical protein [Pseudomonadota bacterium]
QLEILKKKQSAEGRWKVLIADLEASDPTRLSQTLEKAKDELYRSLDEAFAISSRALPIRDLAKSLSETHGVTDDRVKTVTSFLEFAEMVRFSNGAAFGSENGSVQSARERIESIRQICLDLPRNPLEKPS